MKAIFKLFILNFLALALLPSCSDDDQSNSEQNDPISGNISPVGSFSVEATNNENELLVKWTNPSNRDVDMVELSYRDVEASLSRATDFSPGHIIIQVERDVTQEYLLKVPYFATYEVSAVAISKAGKRSVPESRIMMPYHEKVDEPELNAMVIDVKNDEGNLTFRLTNEEIPQDIPVLDRISEMQAGIRYIRDIQTMMQELKDHNIYTIARIVCFKDPILAEAQPELALTKPDGKPVTDANGLAWVNPYRQEVWEYLTELAEMAADLGFDEIQYDYVRFPVGSDADAADYGVDMEAYPKRQAIQDFLSYAGDRLHEKGCVVTADVFGTIIGSETDVQTVGQDYTALGQTVDAISPMVYPSHYANGVFGLKVPDAHPYETVSTAMQGSAEELQEIPEAERAVVRPWLQAFTATWVPGHISYNGTQIREQIQAVYDAGYEEWILWNATNRYSPDGLLFQVTVR